MNWEKGVAELEGESERVTRGSRESGERDVRAPKVGTIVSACWSVGMSVMFVTPSCILHWQSSHLLLPAPPPPEG